MDIDNRTVEVEGEEIPLEKLIAGYKRSKIEKTFVKKN
jgi:hypothetical protein